MSSVRALHGGFRDLIHQAARFGEAALVALNGGIGLATLFRYWSYKKWVWPAATAAAAVALAISHAGNRYRTFRHRQRTGVRQGAFRFCCCREWVWPKRAIAIG